MSLRRSDLRVAGGWRPLGNAILTSFKNFNSRMLMNRFWFFRKFIMFMFAYFMSQTLILDLILHCIYVMPLLLSVLMINQSEYPLLLRISDSTSHYISILSINVAVSSIRRTYLNILRCFVVISLLISFFL